jgi:threonylcarbamoyladenosine tRNA methylthiotransferase MtaB
MNRRYDTLEFREKAKLIRSYMPDAGLTTDIIVGFPGETEREYLETVSFVEEIGFSRIHVFKYSPRKGTPAAKMEGQIPGGIKNDRSERLIELGEKLSLKFQGKFNGSLRAVLYEEGNSGKGMFEGYTTNYIRVKTPSQKDLIGDIIDTRIVVGDHTSMKGTLR